MRGHGTVNVRFAFESQLDEIAAVLGLDPADVRRRNLLKPPCITVNGLRVLSYGLPECIEQVVARSQWRAAPGQAGTGTWPRHRLLPLRQRRGQFHHPFRHAALDRQHQGGPRRRRGRLHGRIGDRPGLRHHDRADRRRSPRLQARAGEGRRRRYRPHAHRPRFLFQPRDLHGRQRHAARGRGDSQADSERRCRAR